MASFSLVQTNDRNINQLQQNIQQALNPILSNPLTYGNIVTAKLVAGPNVINHGLGRLLQGWIPVRQMGANGALYDTAVDTQSITIVSSAAYTAVFYFF